MSLSGEIDSIRPMAFWWTLGIIAAAIALLAAAIVALALWPLDPGELTTRIAPIEDRDKALALIEKLKAEIPDSVRPECRGYVFDHGRKTEDVFVLMHGLTNCPAQFREFGELLFERGANVLIPRTPYHGYLNDYMANQKLLTGQAMINAADTAINAAHAFGDRIIVVGLSVNGTTAAWLAQNRDDIDLAVIISPFFAPHGIEPPWDVAAARILYRLPNALVWWDRVAKDELDRPEHAYPMFATHPIAHVMRVGVDATRDAEIHPLAAARALIVTSASDIAVNNGSAEKIADRWEALAPGRVATFEFPLDDAVPHDSIDPAQPGARTDLVYPKLIELIDANKRKL